MTPKISVVIPTLNAAKVLEGCLESISIQDYPKEYVEIIIADGGSTDSTREIATKYNAVILENPLKTGEAGKAVGVKHANGEFVALIDSDNLLPDDQWFNQMIEPLRANPEAVGSEPWKFTYRKEDGFIDRYCALMGMNDPICFFIGNYDRVNVLSGKWTGIPHTEVDKGDYIIAELGQFGLPTIGANGTVFRSEFIKNRVTGDYLFDIDILADYIDKNGPIKFIKTKNSITHLYCGSNISKFVRKQKRRINDLMYYRELGTRSYNWEFQTKGITYFIVASILSVPLFGQALYGYIKKRDSAWLFHPIACWIGLFVNTFGVLFSQFNPKIQNREKWSQ